MNIWLIRKDGKRVPFRMADFKQTETEQFRAMAETFECWEFM